MKKADHSAKNRQTSVDLPLEEIIGGRHAINANLNVEEIDIYITCRIGDLLVTDAAGRAELFVGPRELNDYRHTGVARLGIGEDPT